MLNSRRRTLVIALAVGGLSILGTGGAPAAADGASTHRDPGQPALAAQTGEAIRANPPEGGEAPGPTHPFCEGGSPVLGSPLCPGKWPPS